MTTSTCPGGSANWLDLLLHRAQSRPDALAFTYLEAGAAAATLTNGELERRARSIGAALQSVMPAGERALLFFPPGLEFVAAFFGCLFAGVIPVPAYPPRRNQKLSRVRAIVADADPGAVLLSADVARALGKTVECEPALASLRLLETDTVGDSLADAWRRPGVTADDIAFLQYTSGSTSTPRGVMVTHGNLLHNSECIRRAFELTPESVSVTWLPSYHDMGLIDGILQPLYTGFRAYVMSPAAFLQQPLEWLQAISRNRATHSGGPNFAYALCVNRTTAEQRAGLDLSSWEAAYNGAEPIRASTLDAFAKAFEPHGFRPRRFFPCYGLAEATLMVSGGPLREGPVLVRADRDRLERNEVVSTSEDAGRLLVGCGRPAHETKVVVVDPESMTPCAEGRVGEIWVAGGGVARGYWRKPEVTEELFCARLVPDGEAFLRTGDLGTVLNGELFVTGRRKDVIIVYGRNHYPQDIERTVEACHPAMRQGCGAAFTVAEGDAERLVVVQEIERASLHGLDVETMAAAARRAVAEEHDLQLHALVLLPPGRIPKTSSGKIQRNASRAAYLAGGLEEVGRSVLREAEPAPVLVSRDALLALAPEERARRVLEYLCGVVGAVLRAPVAWDTRLSPIQLGMDSLMATDVQHRLEGDLGVVVPAVAFLSASSMHEIASRISTALSGAEAATAPARALAPNGERRLSRGQQALWFLQRTAPSSAAYNVSVAARVHSSLDREVLRDTLRWLTRRHAALRTSFPVVDGRPVQSVLPDVEPDLEWLDATMRDPPELRGDLAGAAHVPFDLARAPLLRTRVYRVGDAEHVVLVTAHHIVVDFWSVELLLDELWAVYAAKHAGIAPSLPPIAHQLADHADWQAEILGSREGAQSGHYWEANLAGAPALSTLNLDRSRGAAKAYRGAVHLSCWDADRMTRIKHSATRHEVTPFVLMLAAFQALLHRHTGQDDIVVGSSVAGRDRSEFAGTVGYLVNQVAIRARPRGELPFDVFLGQVRDAVLAALSHQGFPLAAVVERLHVARGSSHAPLFQTMLVLERPLRVQGLAALAAGWAGSPVELHGIRMESMELDQRTSQFDLTLRIIETQDGWALRWEYDTDLFDAATIDRLRSQLEVLLEGAMADPTCRIGALPLLTPDAREALLVKWNGTAAPFPEGACVHELFESHVSRTPAAIAVEDPSERLSYAELNVRANRLAHDLRRLGVGPEVRVGVFAHTSVELVVALLGVLKAGGAYVPIDPSCPARRMQRMLEDSNACVVLTQRDLATRLPSSSARVVIIGAQRNGSTETSEDPGRVADVNNLAYVIYTSGSTGEPKGAMVSHRGLVNYLSWAARAYEAGGGAGAPVNTPIGFDATITSLFAPLVSGNRVLLLPEDDALAALTETLSRGRDLTLVKLTPAHLDLLRNTVRDPAGAARAFVVGGEALSAASVAFWRERSPGTRIFNEYGPTETVVGCCVHEVAPNESPSNGNVPIGRPIANTQLYILDPRSEPVPVGVPGELYIGGAGVARGYLGRADLTAARFVPDPFGRPGARLYRTGDLVRHLPDGEIEFLGRLDDQVKIRGFRVELGEIEVVMRQHPSVEDAAVVLHGQDRASQRLVAYVVWRPNERVATDELRRFLAERLPAYMQPAAFASLAALPLTSNGKVNRKELPVVEAARRDLETAFVAPEEELEKSIASVWRDVLALDRVGRDDNFFDLGGHSLLAAEAHHRLEEKLGRRFELVHLLQHPTVRALAEHLRAAAERPYDSERIESRVALQRRAASLRRQRARTDGGSSRVPRAAGAQRRGSEATITPERARAGDQGDEHD